jgi:L-iditol 2-dehydrogenase
MAATNGKKVLRASHGNPSLVATADHKIKVVEAPIEEPGPGDVLLHVKATGICG